MQRLVWKGQVLLDTRTLLSYELIDNTVLHLIRQVPVRAAPSTQGAIGGNLGQFQQHLVRNPDVMEQMLNTPHMQSLLGNPEVMRSLINMNPQMKQLMEQNPELGHMLNDPEFLQRSIEAFRNPAVMRELMRNTDRAMSNIESIPGGFAALRKMHEELQAPMWAATTDQAASVNSGSNPVTYSNTTDAGPSAQPLPNPWSPAVPATAPAPLGYDPSSMAAMMQDPNMQQLMSTMFQGNRQPQVPPLANPSFLAHMFDPATMSAMSQLESSLQGFSSGQTPAGLSGLNPASPVANFTASFSPFLNAVNDNPELQYRSQLHALRSMGFTDTAACIRALQQSGGNVNRAVDLLLGANEAN